MSFLLDDIVGVEHSRDVVKMRIASVFDNYADEDLRNVVKTLAYGTRSDLGATVESVIDLLAASATLDELQRRMEVRALDDSESSAAATSDRLGPVVTADDARAALMRLDRYANATLKSITDAQLIKLVDALATAWTPALPSPVGPESPGDPFLTLGGRALVAELLKRLTAQ
jgi:hypothetical protein